MRLTWPGTEASGRRLIVEAPEGPEDHLRDPGAVRAGHESRSDVP